MGGSNRRGVPGFVPEELRCVNSEENDEIAEAVAAESSRKAATVFNHLDQYVNGRLAADSPWLAVPEIPTSEEIGYIVHGKVIKNVKELDTNIIKGPWPDKDFYLRTQYELLREDGVSPLRDAVDDFRGRPRMLEKESKENTRIYDSVFIIGVTLGRKGFTVKIEFSTKRAEKRIRWTQSKRLKSGTIVALSPASDNFQSICKVAVVVARPLIGLEVEFPLKPSVHIQFADPDDVEIDPQVEWVMVEASGGYWEANRHTLRALQKLNGESFPLARHVVNLEKDVDTPSYRQEHAIMDLKCVSHDLKGPVDVINDWPNLTALNKQNEPMSEMDESQLCALHRIVTKSLAIVQGPPGTGKTFVSVQALRVMLDNMTVDDPPIIVSAQTNHALDQLLRHIAKFEPLFVRLGGQTTDLDVIASRTMQNLRERKVVPSTSTSKHARQMEKILGDELKEALAPLSTGAPFSPATFLHHDLISQKQFDSLENQTKKWVGEDFNDMDDPMSMFCEDQIEPFRKAKEIATTVEYEEIDERLKSEEEDLETGFNDDRFEQLYGIFVPFEAGFVPERGAEDDDSFVQRLLSQQQDMGKIPRLYRGSIYGYLQKAVKAKVLEQVRHIAARATKMSRDYQIGRWEQDHMLLNNIRVIGMTTTGLSKYRALITSLQPKVVLIEEAAETLEAYTTAAFMPSVQHMILVGDHQQLRGHCNVKEFEDAPWNLDVSMFERLVRNGIEFTQLKMQRRMRPEIREIINPIYKDLTDHPSVRGRENVPGMGGLNVCFFTHKFPESNDDALSKQNHHEARMIVAFLYYLFLNGMSTSKMTVLTFYNGQRKLIGKYIGKHKELTNQRCNVATVDSYQGEENEIVLLSLVRNNANGQIGFLGVDNRVCVALSRARCGFYMFGDCQAVFRQSKLWFDILTIMGDKQETIVSWLPLVCKNHSKTTMVNDAGHMEDLDGGCRLECGEKRPCGHECNLKCHPEPHEDIPCVERCLRKMLCGHTCSNQCWSINHACGRCTGQGKTELPPGAVKIRTPSPRKLIDLGESRQAAPARAPQTLEGENFFRDLRCATPPESQQGLQDLQFGRSAGITRTKESQAWEDFAAGGVIEHDRRLHEENQRKYKENIDRQARKVLAQREAEKEAAQHQATTRDDEALLPDYNVTDDAVADEAAFPNDEEVLIDLNLTTAGTPSPVASDFSSLPSRPARAEGAKPIASASTSTRGADGTKEVSVRDIGGGRKVWKEIWNPPDVERRIAQLEAEKAKEKENQKGKAISLEKEKEKESDEARGVYELAEASLLD